MNQQPTSRTDGTIFTARVIRTANPSHPTAEAIAIRDGKVLAVGTLEECQEWGISEVDNRFADKVLTAGFVEAHSHLGAGIFSLIPYVGWFPRRMGDGSLVEGITSTEQLIERLREIGKHTPADQPIVVAGFDPIYIPGERLSRHHLDEADPRRPIFVFHASAHLATVNSAVLAKYDIGPGHPSPGVGFDDDGTPNGELREPAAMGLARDEFRMIISVMAGQKVWQGFADAMQIAGITTATDLGNEFVMNDDVLSRASQVFGGASFPVRLVAATRVVGDPSTQAKVAERIRTAAASSDNKLMFPIAKLVLDGSIQGFTGTIDWPGYFTGEDHSQFLVPPEQVVDMLRPFHQAGIGIHCHCNGNLASGVFIDAIEQLLKEHAWLDHRHTITHAQLITHAQMRKAAALGMHANFFVNHVWYWGDQHRDITVGPDRARGINPCATADRIGLPYSFHTDAPVTPPGHLHTMWAAVNRITPSGRVLGPNERVSIDRAFHAVTIDAAHQLHIDDKVGSLEVGKFADMTVLDEDPYEVDPMHIRDINVWGTILGGQVQPNPSR